MKGKSRYFVRILLKARLISCFLQANKHFKTLINTSCEQIECLKKKKLWLATQKKWWLPFKNHSRFKFKVCIVFKLESTQQWIPKKLKFRYCEKSTKYLKFICQIDFSINSSLLLQNPKFQFLIRGQSCASLFKSKKQNIFLKLGPQW